VTRRDEVRLLRTVKKNRVKVLRAITNDLNGGGVVRVHPKTIQRYLHNNKIFRRVVRKKMVVREGAAKRKDFLGVWNDGDELLIYIGIK
jgi:hypothetical protein